uniref:Protein CDV3 homolog n=1 Tax=Panagrellus redivivus TaxID=6233 RepID=A0A7E4UZT8_PANRE
MARHHGAAASSGRAAAVARSKLRKLRFSHRHGGSGGKAALVKSVETSERLGQSGTIGEEKDVSTADLFDAILTAAAPGPMALPGIEMELADDAPTYSSSTEDEYPSYSEEVREFEEAKREAARRKFLTGVKLASDFEDVYNGTLMTSKSVESTTLRENVTTTEPDRHSRRHETSKEAESTGWVTSNSTIFLEDGIPWPGSLFKSSYVPQILTHVFLSLKPVFSSAYICHTCMFPYTYFPQTSTSVQTNHNMIDCCNSTAKNEHAHASGNRKSSTPVPSVCPTAGLFPFYNYRKPGGAYMRPLAIHLSNKIDLLHPLAFIFRLPGSVSRGRWCTFTYSMAADCVAVQQPRHIIARATEAKTTF